MPGNRSRPWASRRWWRWAWVGETAPIEAWRDAGFQPIPFPATEIHTALSSGLITAVPTTPVAALAFQWFGLAKNMLVDSGLTVTGQVLGTPTIDKSHRQKVLSIVLADFVNRHNARMVQLSSGLGFSTESGNLLCVGKFAGANHLQRDSAVNAFLFGRVDSAHPSTTDQADDFELPEEWLQFRDFGNGESGRRCRRARGA